MKLLNLPTELIVFIFERVPVTDLVLRLPLTCTRFINLSKIACNRRTSLALIFGKENQLCFPFANVTSIKRSFVTTQRSTGTLRYKAICTLSHAFLAKIVNKFPNVRALQFSADGITASQVKEAVAEKLLLCLLPKLEALNLVMDFAVTNELERTKLDSPMAIADALQHSISVINRMHKLGRLVLSTWEKLDVTDLPIIGQLREFYFHSLDDTDIVYESMLKYGVPNQELARIGLGTDTKTDSLFVTSILLFNEANHLTSTISHLDLYDLSDSLVQEEKLLALMPNLLALYVNWNQTRPLVQLIKILPKSRLDYLGISINRTNRDDDQQMTDLSSLVNQYRLDSVKTLTITYYNAPSHESLLHLNVEQIFPNLESICIRSFSYCFICQYAFADNLYEDEDHVEKRTRCIELAVQPMQQMESKPKITIKYHSRPQKCVVTVEL